MYTNDNLLSFTKLMYQSNQSSNMPPGHTPGIWHLCRPGEEEIWLSESIWSPCVRGGEFELHPRFHVKSLAWWAIMGDTVLEDFRGKDCAFMANWLRGKGLNKLCSVFERISGFEYMKILRSQFLTGRPVFLQEWLLAHRLKTITLCQTCILIADSIAD